MIQLLLNKILSRWVPAAKGPQGPLVSCSFCSACWLVYQLFLGPLFISPSPEIQYNPGFVCFAEICLLRPANKLKLSNQPWATLLSAQLPLPTLVQRLRRSAISGSVAAAVRRSCRTSHRGNIKEKAQPWLLYLHPVSFKLSFSCTAFVTLIMSTWA